MKRDKISLFHQLRAYFALAISALLMVMFIVAIVYFWLIEAGWVDG